MSLPNTTVIDVTNTTAVWAGSPVSGGAAAQGEEIQSFFLTSDGYLWAMQVDDPNFTLGNLTLTKYQIVSGQWTQVEPSMHMHGFGHGVAFGMQPVGGGFYNVWSECAVDKNDKGRGTGIAQYAYFSNQTITSADVTPFYPGTSAGAATDWTCSLDMNASVLAVRFMYSGIHLYQAYDLTKAIARDWSAQLIPAFGFEEPALVDPLTPSGPLAKMQGWGFDGRHLYINGQSNNNKDPLFWSADLLGTQNNSSGYIARSAAKTAGAASHKVRC